MKIYRKRNQPSHKTPCIECLYKLGFGCDRISKIVAMKKTLLSRKTKHLRDKLSRHGAWLKVLSRKPKKKPQSRYIKKLSTEDRLKKLSQKKLKTRLRRYLWYWFKFGLYPKAVPKLVGCSREEFISHIQSQFTTTMTIENYGKAWELDHKEPCNRFDLYNEFERKACFHFSNIRPCFNIENRKKSAKPFSKADI
jgi:hypothetical protein